MRYLTHMQTSCLLGQYAYRVTYGKLNDFNNSPVYFNDGFEPNAELFLQGRTRNCKIHIAETHLYVPQEWNNRNPFLYMERMIIIISSVEWMKGVCHTWSWGRHSSPSLPSCPVTTGIRNSALPKSDPRAEISVEIVWYDALAPRPEILLSCSSNYGN